MIIFVGDCPAKANLSNHIAFVGTKSYKKLLEWMYKLDIDLTDVTVCNKDQLLEYRWGGQFYIEVRGSFYLDIDKDLDILIPLGNNAEKVVKATGLDYVKLPHPSGQNRLFNKPGFEEEVLSECRRELTKRGYYGRYEHYTHRRSTS